MAAARLPVRIGHVIRNATVFSFKRWRKEKAMNTDTLLQNVADLFTLLDQREVEYLLVGGVALLQYIEGRNTEDIDLIMALASLQKLPEIGISHQDLDFVRGDFGTLQIDILLTQNPLFEKVRQEYRTVQEFLERQIPCATVEGLILLKLYALPSLYRRGEFARVGIYENDIATLMYYYEPNVQQLLGELRPYLSDTDMVELNNIASELQERIVRFRQNHQS